MTHRFSLAALGWQPFFQQQLSLDEWQTCHPVRICAQHRSVLDVMSEQGVFSIPVMANMPSVTVGDWLLLTPEQHVVRALDRQTGFQRMAAGQQRIIQWIAANIDTAFILCSLNNDFNLNRIERYLSLVHQAGVEPVVVLTKSDLNEQSESYLTAVQALDPMLPVMAVNCLDTNSLDRLTPWCKTGKTIVLLGSSGVGKSTLSNTLMGAKQQMTGAIREDDSKGRHTTTQRTLLPLASGGLILDTPGMRELQLAACETGVATTFSDIDVLIHQCRFSDCQHQSEPGCAVQKAIQQGDLEPRRLRNYQKLLREQALNQASLAERHQQDRQLTKYYKRVQQDAKRIKGQ